MKVTTKKWDAAEYLDSPEMIREYLKAVMDGGTVPELISALGDVARAKGMTEVAKKAGLNRQNLYKTLNPEKSPRLETIVKLLGAFDLKLTVEQA